MGEVVPLFGEGPRRGLGCYVEPRNGSWAVVDYADRLISEHRTIWRALAICQWHTRTRFVYVTGSRDSSRYRDDELCWDSQLQRFVSWDEALEAVSKIINRYKHA